MKFIRNTLLTLIAVTVFSGAAKADYFVWKDAQTGLSLSFPDSWRIVSSADPNDILTIMAPSGRAHAACRVRVNDDQRFSVYPAALDWAVQKAFFSVDFWDRYLYEFTDHSILQVTDGAGLGRGWASYAMANYKSAVQGPYMRRTGLMFASFYNDKLYVLECSSHEDAFLKWKHAFMSVAGSIDFAKTHHELLHGHYRPFLWDEKIRLKGSRGDDIVEY